MAVKEGYRQTEVGVIPEDWEVLTLGEVCIKLQDGNYGGSYPKANEFLDYGVPFLTSKAIGKYGFLREDLIDYISPQKHLELAKAHIESEDVLFTNRGASVGAIGFVSDEIAGGNIGPQLTLLRANQETTLPTYLYHLMKSEIVQRQIINQDSGSAMNFFGIESTKKFLLPIPIKTEQNAIATALSDIDGLINSLTKLIEKKKNIKQGAMQELLTGKKRLDGFSGEWVFRTMGNLFKFSGGYSASREHLSTEGYSYLHYGDIHGSAKTFVDIKDEYLEIPKLNIELNKISKDKLLQDGDIVFVDASEDDEGVSRHVVIRNTQGIPFISGLHTIVAKNRTNELDNLYKEFCFQSQELKKQFSFYAVGIKVSGISRSNIIKIVLRIPPTIEEQTAIAAILSDMDSEIETLQTKLDKYKAIKQGMMQELLTGRIRLLEGA